MSLSNSKKSYSSYYLYQVTEKIQLCDLFHSSFGKNKLFKLHYHWMYMFHIFLLGIGIVNRSLKVNFSLSLLILFSGSISNIDGAEYHCNKTQVRKVISGVVGAASSVTSIQVANLLRLFKIPQVSRSSFTYAPQYPRLSNWISSIIVTKTTYK